MQSKDNTSNILIHQLNGYLNALGTLCGQTGYRYGFRVVERFIENDIDTCLAEMVEANASKSVHSEKCKYIGKIDIDYYEFNSKLSKSVIDHMQLSKDAADNIKREILWQFHEYFGLYSTDLLGSTGAFNPTASGPLWELQLDSSVSSDFSYFALKVETQLIYMQFEYE